jgi:hypothetical protein
MFTRALHWPFHQVISSQSLSLHLILLRSILILSTHLCFIVVSSAFFTKMLFSYSPCMLHALLISSFLTWLFQSYFVNSTSYEAPRYSVFSNLLSLHPTLVQIFSPAPCSQTPPVCVTSLISDQVSHSCKTTGEVIVLCILIFTFLNSR